MTVKELKEALNQYPDDMEVQILSIFAPNYMEVQKDFYSIEDIELNEKYSCVTLLESNVSTNIECINL